MRFEKFSSTLNNLAVLSNTIKNTVFPSTHNKIAQ